eukprot:s3094_g9.t1
MLTPSMESFRPYGPSPLFGSDHEWAATQQALRVKPITGVECVCKHPDEPGSCIDRRILLPLVVADLEPEATRPAYCAAEVMTIPAVNFGRALQSGELCRLLWKPQRIPEEA